jgi:hypothetical protein
MELIGKSALVAEIEKLKDEAKIYPSYFGCGRLSICKELMNFLDTLEVKEVDVEKESELIANSIMISVQANLYHTNVYDYEKRCYKHSDLKDAARKGIELSLKAQKGE